MQSVSSIAASAPTTPVPYSTGTVPANSTTCSPVHSLTALHLINGEHFSGAERVQQLLGTCLPTMGVQANFVCLKPGKFTEHCGLEPKLVIEIGMQNRFDLTIIGRVAQHAIAIDADLIHAHTPRTAMIASFVAKKCRLPWVYHVHSPTARDSTRSWVNRINDLVEAYSLRNADHIITVSKSLRREMLSHGFSRHKITSIANGVAAQPPIDPTERLHKQHWTLGMVALIRPRKGIEVLLEAIAKLGEDRKRITLDVIGGFESPEYESSVRKLIDKLGLSKTVHLRGFSNDVPSVMRTLDAMVLPSLFGEGMPMVVLEALACGVPVIATEVEGTPEVVRDGLEGVLAEPQNADSLAESIRRFISDRETWCQWSQQCVDRHREGFSDVQMATKTARLYHRIVDHFDY